MEEIGVGEGRSRKEHLRSNTKLGSKGRHDSFGGLANCRLGEEGRGRKGERFSSFLQWGNQQQCGVALTWDLPEGSLFVPYSSTVIIMIHCTSIIVLTRVVQG